MSKPLKLKAGYSGNIHLVFYYHHYNFKIYVIYSNADKDV